MVWLVLSGNLVWIITVQSPAAVNAASSGFTHWRRSCSHFNWSSAALIHAFTSASFLQIFRNAGRSPLKASLAFSEASHSAKDSEQLDGEERLIGCWSCLRCFAFAVPHPCRSAKDSPCCPQGANRRALRDTGTTIHRIADSSLRLETASRGSLLSIGVRSPRSGRTSNPAEQVAGPQRHDWRCSVA